MLFQVSTSITALWAIITLLRITKALIAGKNKVHVLIHQDRPMIVLIICMAIMMPVALSVFSVELPSWSGVAAQCSALAGGLIMLVWFFIRFLKTRSALALLFSLSGLSLTFIYADSVLFISAPGYGELNYEFLKESAHIDEGIDCPGGMMIIHLQKKDEASDWRCPKDVVYLGNTRHPLLPWPDYTSGKSVAITNGLQSLLEEAEKKGTALPDNTSEKP